MTAAYIYFGLMLTLMLPLAFVHMWCRDVVKLAPQIMPDSVRRDRFRYMELAMVAACLTVIWYMWAILDYMVTFCATSPAEGAIAHMPWIVLALVVLLTKVGHLMRLMAQRV
jgi:hypothetical protein